MGVNDTGAPVAHDYTGYRCPTPREDKVFKVQGVKHDYGKTRYNLLPPRALKEVADVLTFGAEKYAVGNWRYVDEPHDRYLSAAMRHIEEYRSGTTPDDETSLHHLAHAICCLMFITDIDLPEEDS